MPRSRLGTPLWRNGPPGKPVLCNACGSRWRTRGTLVHYIPKHAQSYMSLDSEKSHHHESRIPFKLRQLRNIPNPIVTQYNEGNLKVEESAAKSELHAETLEDSNMKSSSGSAISSSSESSFQLENKDGSEISGSVKTSSIWDCHIPSRKRSLIKHRSLSSVERLHRKLLHILHYEKPSINDSCGCPEGELIYFDNYQTTHDHEIGLGAVLLNTPIISTEQKSKT